MAKRNSWIKSLFWLLLKFGIAGGLLWWMIEAGKVDFRQLRVYLDQTEILWIYAGIWFINVILIQSARWKSLLWGLGINIGWFRVLQLQSVGLFFNTAIPGAVGGDVVKAVYIVRDQRMEHRTPAAMSILMDRITGLFGLFTLGAVAVSFQFDQLWQNPLMRPLLIATYALVAAMLLFLVLVFVRIEDQRDPFLRLLNHKVPGFTFLKKIYVSLRSYRHRPSAIIFSWAASILVQCGFFYVFLILTQHLTKQPFNVAVMAAIYALGALTTALPIAPGGLGVGHAAFDKLFELAGLTGGANVFNVFCLTMLAFSLSGAIPYLFVKSKLPSKEEAQKLTRVLD